MKKLDILILLLLAALWGSSFLFMRIAAPILGPVWLIEMRVLLAGLILLPLLLHLRLWDEVRRRAIPLFLLGCFNSAVPFCLFAFASISLPVGFTAILNATVPLFGTIVAAVWLHEKLTIRRTIGLILGFTGVLILIGWKTFTPEVSFFAAIAAGLAASIMYAIAAPYAKKELADVSSLTIATASQLSAALVLLPILPFTVPKALPTPTIVLSVVALALFSSSLAYILYFRLIQNIGSTKTLTVAYLIPPFAMLWGSIVLGESVSPSMAIGCGSIFLGTAIANDIWK